MQAQLQKHVSTGQRFFLAVVIHKSIEVQSYQGPISRTDLSLASYHFVLYLSPKTDLSLFVKLAPDLQVR